MRPVALSLLAILAAGPGESAKSSGQVVLARSYLPGELGVSGTGPWTCVTLRDSRVESHACEVSVLAEPESEGYAASERISSTAAGTLFFALKGVTGLREGPVPTVSHAQIPLTELTASVTLGAVGDDLPTLGLWGKPGAYELTYQVGGRTQVLETIKRVDSINHTGPSLLFAGDLDGDGKLDLLLNVDGHHAGEDLRLYLSSQAGPDELVHEVAHHFAANC